VKETLVTAFSVYEDLLHGEVQALHSGAFTESWLGRYGLSRPEKGTASG
jgi:hypothetical protein